MLFILLLNGLDSGLQLVWVNTKNFETCLYRKDYFYYIVILQFDVKRSVIR